MPLVNRDKDIPEQRDVVSISQNAVATGVTLALWTAPYAAEISVVALDASGISGTPTGQLSINRFVVGSGVTNLGTGGFSVVTLTSFGTSGAQIVPQNSSGNSLIQLAKGDQLQYLSGAANSSCYNLNITMAIKCLQDIKSHFGL
jgi:hypothetical protein